MKEKMTNGTLMDSNLFKFSPVPGSKLQSFSFLLLCSVTLFLRSLFSFIPWFKLIWGLRGEYLEQNSVGKESLPLSAPNPFSLSLFFFFFYPFLFQQNLYGINTTMLCGKKEKPSAPLALLEAGGCQAPVQQCIEFQILSSFLCILGSEITLCLYVNMDSQHLPTCICLLSLV